MKFSKSLLLSVAALIAPLAMQATPLSIAPFSVDGLTFSNFNCTSITTNACSALSINPIRTPDGIMIAGGLNASNGNTLDVALTYNVTSTSAITSIGMLFNGYITPSNGSGSVSVSEFATLTGTITPDSNQVVVSATNGTFGVSNDLSGTVVLFNPSTSITVNKDINLTSAEGTTANLSFVDQTFSVVSPEPGSTAMIGVGLSLLGLVMRRRAAK